MASKKYLLLAGFMTLFSVSELMAQESNSGMYKGGGYDFSDTSLIPEKRMAQQRDFMAGQYDFPSKPRNQWEIGITAGLYNVSGDVRSKSLFVNSAISPLKTTGWGIHVRKAWGYVLSTRLQYIHGSASGFNHQSTKGYWGHSASPYMTVGGGYATASGSRVDNVYYSYWTRTNELTLQLVAALNNLKFHRARNKVSYYALGGVGLLTYHTMIDALDASGARYKFDTIDDGLTGGSVWADRKEKNNRLKDMFDGTYETEAEKHDNRNPWNKKGTLRAAATVGAGAQIRLGKKLSLQIEDKVTFTNDDLVDGERWQEMAHSANGYGVTSSMTRDFDNINYLSIGLNVHLGGKSVDPLWWMNPMDYGYNEVKHKGGGPSKCDNDSDGDGISDCFDRCPNTPGGVSVDSHGCPFDTDGDGVADYKDKQLITPTECQPVDADGVGKCPDPECCKGGTTPPVGCSSISNGSINFAAGTSKLSAAAMSQLTGLAGSMRSNPNCKAVIVGCGNGSKIEQQRSWDRVNSVINYMVDKQGIDRERFIFQYGTSCDANAVEYRSAAQGEEGPSNTPPPFPNLRRN